MSSTLVLRGVTALSVLSVLALFTATGCDNPASTGAAGSGGAGSGGPGGSGGRPPGSGGAGGGVLDGGAGPLGACADPATAALGVQSHPSAGANHTVVCSAVSYTTAPPSSGTHYPSWPAYVTYADPVPWGFLVHGLEHGAIVIVYNCPAGCADEVAAAQAWIDGLPPEADCGNARPRIVLAPDPTLDVRWAASAWTWTLRACSFDQAMFQQFFDGHYNAGPEFICSGGANQSATGWCP